MPFVHRADTLCMTRNVFTIRDIKEGIGYGGVIGCNNTAHLNILVHARQYVNEHVL